MDKSVTKSQFSCSDKVILNVYDSNYFPDSIGSGLVIASQSAVDNNDDENYKDDDN